LKDTLPVIWVDGLPISEVTSFQYVHAGVFCESPVEVGQLPASIGAPNHSWDCFGNLPQLVLALLERNFRFFHVVNVRANAIPMKDFTRLIAEGFTADEIPM
jgi:hypothetical protein